NGSLRLSRPNQDDHGLDRAGGVDRRRETGILVTRRLSSGVAASAAIFRASTQSRSCDCGRAAPENRPREGRLLGRGSPNRNRRSARVRSRAPAWDIHIRSNRADDLAAGPQGSEDTEEEGGHAGPPDGVELAYRAA